jgi:hypothetical protein
MRVALFLGLTAAAWAQQAPAGITVTLRASGGRTQFRLGEIVPVELVFQSSTRGVYRIWEVPSREIMGEEFDDFQVDPKEGAAVFPQRAASTYDGPTFEPIAIYGSPATVLLTLNDWVAFRKPGHYRITLETDRAVTGSPFKLVTLRSNAIEIDEVDPEPGWAEAQLSRASDLVSNSRPDYENDGARILRFLGTRQAADAMVRFHLYGPPGAQYELVRGMQESPFRADIISGLEAGIAAGATASQMTERLLMSLKAAADR